MKNTKKILLAGSVLAGVSMANASNVIQNIDLGTASEVRTNLLSEFNSPALNDFTTGAIEAKCGEENTKTKTTKKADEHKGCEGKCGEGKCGEGKCGEKSTKTDSKSKTTDAKSTEKKEKTSEHKCGEGKCGEE